MLTTIVLSNKKPPLLSVSESGGSTSHSEYVYMPASEIGVEKPICVLETIQGKIDISMEKALKIIVKRSLKPVKHPRLGHTSC